jgi:hypothetical protein
MNSILPSYLPVFPSVFLPSYLSVFLPVFLPSYLPRSVIQILLHYLPPAKPLFNSITLYNNLPTIVIFHNFLAKEELYFYLQDRAYFDVLPEPPVPPVFLSSDLPPSELIEIIEEVKAKMMYREKKCEEIKQHNIKIFYKQTDIQAALDIRDFLVQKQFATIEKGHDDRIIMKLISAKSQE